MNITHATARRPPRRDPELLFHMDVVVDGHLHINYIRVARRRGNICLNMPDRPTLGYCTACRADMRITDSYCPSCGRAQGARTQPTTANGRPKRFASLVWSESIEFMALLEAVAIAVLQKTEAHGPGVTSHWRTRMENNAVVVEASTN